MTLALNGKSPRRRFGLLAGGALAVVLSAVVAMLAFGTALAHQASLTGSTTCNPDGTWTISWKITNSEDDKVMFVTNEDISDGLPDPNFVPEPVGFSAFGAAVTSNIPNSVDDVQLSATATWYWYADKSDDNIPNNGKSGNGKVGPSTYSKEVNRPQGCNPPPPPPPKPPTVVKTAGSVKLTSPTGANFTIVITNPSDGHDKIDVLIKDEAAYVSKSGTGSCNNLNTGDLNTGNLNCELDDGENVTLTVFIAAVQQRCTPVNVTNTAQFKWRKHGTYSYTSFADTSLAEVTVPQSGDEAQCTSPKGPDVTVEGGAAFHFDYDWDLTKTVDPGVGKVGDLFTYTVTATRSEPSIVVDTPFNGTVTISNPNIIHAIQLNSVTANAPFIVGACLADSIPALGSTTCPVTGGPAVDSIGPHNLSVTVSYTPTGHPAALLPAVATGIPFTRGPDVDATVQVIDTLKGPLGPADFPSYSLAFDACGLKDNTASLDQATGEDASDTAQVDVLCDGQVGLSKSDGQLVGDEILWMITITNAADFPKGVSFTENADLVSSTCTSLVGAYTCTVPANSSATVVFSTPIPVRGNVCEPMTVTNTAAIIGGLKSTGTFTFPAEASPSCFTVTKVNLGNGVWAITITNDGPPATVSYTDTYGPNGTGTTLISPAKGELMVNGQSAFNLLSSRLVPACQGQTVFNTITLELVGSEGNTPIGSDGDSFTLPGVTSLCSTPTPIPTPITPTPTPILIGCITCNPTNTPPPTSTPVPSTQTPGPTNTATTPVGAPPSTTAVPGASVTPVAPDAGNGVMATVEGQLGLAGILSFILGLAMALIVGLNRSLRRL